MDLNFYVFKDNSVICWMLIETFSANDDIGCGQDWKDILARRRVECRNMLLILIMIINVATTAQPWLGEFLQIPILHSYISIFHRDLLDSSLQCYVISTSNI